MSNHLENAIERAKTLGTAGMELAANLCRLESSTIKGVDYVRRESVMNEVIAWRAAFDNAPTVDLRAALQAQQEEAKEIVLNLNHISYEHIINTYVEAFSPLDKNIMVNDIDYHICELIKAEAKAPAPATLSDEQEFSRWFFEASHRAKYSKDHPAYLAAREAWDQARGRAEIDAEDHLAAAGSSQGQDTVRLDFVTESQTTIYREVEERREPLTDGSGGYRKCEAFIGWSLGVSSETYATPRAAIDAARAAREGQDEL